MRAPPLRRTRGSSLRFVTETDAGAATDDGAIEKLRALVRIPTVSNADEAAIDRRPFDEFIELLDCRNRAISGIPWRRRNCR